MRGTRRRLGFEGFVCAIAVAGVWLAASGASAQVVPRHCGMRAGAETYGSIMIGSTVVLGRHTPWAGDENWDPGMDRFVGATAVVTQLAGLDTAGCPGIRVGVDGGQWFWRVRDVQLPMAMPPPPPPGDPLPRYCGMSGGAETYGVLRPGMRIVLGRHTPWAGDDNWTGEMNRYVGSLATVTRLDGVDTAGCPGVRVDVDGGSYFWRIRDAQLGAVAPPPPPPPPVAIPAWCGMRSGAEIYGPVTVGSWVVLGVHSPWNGDTNWAPEMMRFVGQRAMVTQLSGLDTSGCPGVRVNVDGGEFFWRIRDMRM